MSENSSKALCSCGKKANKLFLPPAVKTDTSFFATGCYDDRLCSGRDDKIQGRRDWKRRLEEKNLVEIDRSSLEQPVPKPDFNF